MLVENGRLVNVMDTKKISVKIQILKPMFIKNKL